MNRRRRNRTATEVQKRIDRAVGVYRQRTSNAVRNGRVARATSTLENTFDRRYVNDPRGRYGSARYGVFNRRTGDRVGTMVDMAH